ncbi:MAG TPA: vitamin K epoxide reductase family protein [Kofleriaceae bacterium]|nr:vitamin K epoxide reductase family protein [Kofleriaceae bacterium]
MNRHSEAWGRREVYASVIRQRDNLATVMRPRPQLIAVIAGAVLGLVFSGFSTYDFASHLDRQVHGVHCSFLPGLSTTDATGVSGCHATMMSPYSSVFRESVWGGIPISLAAMSVFAFLLFIAFEITFSRRQDDRRAAGFLALAAALPAVTSVIMAVISLGVLGATCKLCIGIYLASALCFVGAILTWRAAGRGVLGQVRSPQAEFLATAATASMQAPHDPAADPAWTSGHATTQDPPGMDPALASTLTGPPSPVPRPDLEATAVPPGVSRGQLAVAFAIGVAFVLLPVAAYASLAPDHSQFIGHCGVLEQSQDRYEVMVPLDPHPGGVPAVEVLDPLCPACRAFEQRLTATSYAAELDRKAVLFPLDVPCNWMIDEASHPGACVVSQAVLCAGDNAPEVVAWSFAEREHIIDAATRDPHAVERMVEARFPDLAKCVGSAKARAELNESMRWAVQNHLQVLTPQLFIDGVKLCNEDVDLGLEYALSRMIARQRAGTLRPAASPTDGAAAPAADEAPAAADTAPAATEGENPTAATEDESSKPTPAAAAGDENPTATEPASAKPAGDENPAATEPEPAEDENPAATEPAPAKPTGDENPAATEPEPAEDENPAATEPEPAEDENPAATEPAPAKPTSDENPAATEPPPAAGDSKDPAATDDGVEP